MNEKTWLALGTVFTAASIGSFYAYHQERVNRQFEMIDLPQITEEGKK